MEQDAQAQAHHRGIARVRDGAADPGVVAHDLQAIQLGMNGRVDEAQLELRLTSGLAVGVDPHGECVRVERARILDRASTRHPVDRARELGHVGRARRAHAHEDREDRHRGIRREECLHTRDASDPGAAGAIGGCPIVNGVFT